MSTDSHEMHQILDRLNQIESGLKTDFRRLEDRFNHLADEGLPAQVTALSGRVNGLSQRLWALVVGFLFLVAGWAWSLSR